MMIAKTECANQSLGIQAVYCLHENDCTKYSWMTYASVLSLKYFHPGIDVLCFVTDETYKGLKKSSHPLLKQVTTEVIDTPPMNCDKLSSRYLKIASGTRVHGPFIFLDSDTLVVRPIDSDNQGFDIAATPDKYVGETSGYFPEWIKPYYTKLNWQIAAIKYYNSGVVIYGQRVSESRFFEKWLENWKMTRGYGLHHDQPSFNYTINRLGLRVKEMTDEFNAMVQVDAKYLKDAIVMHFYESAATDRRSKYKDLIDDLKIGRISTGRKICKRALKWNDIYYDHSVINLLLQKRHHEIMTKIMNKMRSHQQSMPPPGKGNNITH